MSESNTKEPEYTPFDGLLKHLTDQFAPELLAYLGDIEHIKECSSIGGEIELMHRLSDRVWKITEDKAQNDLTYLLHLEFESSPSDNIGERVGMYGWGVFQKEQLPVRHIVWYVGELKPKGWPEDTWFRFVHKEMKIETELRVDRPRFPPSDGRDYSWLPFVVTAVVCVGVGVVIGGRRAR